MFSNQIVIDFKKWLGKEGISFFSHLKGLSGSIAPVLKLNYKRKGMPVYPVHLREGMSIRNWMRSQKEFEKYSADDFDNYWILLVEEAIK